MLKALQVQEDSPRRGVGEGGHAAAFAWVYMCDRHLEVCWCTHGRIGGMNALDVEAMRMVQQLPSGMPWLMQICLTGETCTHPLTAPLTVLGQPYSADMGSTATDIAIRSMEHI